MKKLSGIESPRRFTESPWAPPSPEFKVTPGTLRNASWTNVRCCSVNSLPSMLSIDWEISKPLWMMVPVTSTLCRVVPWSTGAAVSACAPMVVKAVTATPAAAARPGRIAERLSALNSLI